MELRDQLEKTLGTSYTLDRELGGGGMSRVFVADEHRLGRKVVVKVLAPELAAGISADRFEREIKVAASLQQANIVPVLSAGDTNGLPYYTMPFVEGESLRSRLAKHGALNITETIRILGDVARALAYAHERGVVHRDIKPDNVLLSGGTAVVTDFGIAKALAASQRESDGNAAPTLTQLGTAIGTPAYMSPEQSAGDPNLDHRTDIYSFGCMAYELLAGQAPFSGRTPQRMLAAHMSEPAPNVTTTRHDTPAALAELIERCMAKDAAARPQSAAEIMRALDSVTSGGSMAAMPPILLGGRGMLTRALLLYAGAFVAVAVLARAATIVIGLPDWVFPGALIVMALGLPVLLFTGYVHRITYQALTATPQVTPGGSEVTARGTMQTLALRASPHISWKRTAVGGAYALGAFTLLVGVFMALRAMGIGPAGSLLARGALAQREALLITDFRVQGADTNLGNVFTEAVRATLSQSKAISLVPPAAVAGALQRMRRPADARVDLPLARDIAAREGIKAIVDGDITPLGNGFVIVLRLVSADSGNELTSFRLGVASPPELIDGIDRLSRQLRGKIGESLRAVQNAPRLAVAITSSLPALRKFTAGVLANRNADYARSRVFFREAVALDSTFADAWYSLAVAAVNGIPETQSRIDEALAMAYRHRDRMLEGRRQDMLARYYIAGPGRDRARGIAVYEQLFASDSNANMANTLALYIEGRREWAHAESLFAYSIRQAPDFPLPYGNIVRSQFAQGKIAAAESSAMLALRRHPQYLTGYLIASMFVYHSGSLDTYERSLDSLRRASAQRLRVEGTRMSSALMLMRGRLRESVARRAETRALDSASGRITPAILDSLDDALIDTWFRGNHAGAAARLDRALERMPMRELPILDRPYFDVARAYALAGRPDRARTVLREFESEADTSLRRSLSFLRHTALGEIALAEGKPKVALDEFRRGDRQADGPASRNPLTILAALGRSFDAANEPDSAIAMYERYRDTPYLTRGHDRDVDPKLLAGVHKRLGELYEARGMRDKAAASYAQFVELWKNADPELQPKVAEVRARLSRLRQVER